jgi:hypothetical protein
VGALLGFLVLASIIGAPVGLLMCLSAARRDLGKTIALTSLASFVVMMVVVMARGPAPATPSQAIASAPESYVEPKPESLTKTEVLANFRFGNFSWQKEGFGTIMKASFLLHNDNPMPLKDIQITCYSSGPSGSIIDTNSRTVFEVVRQRSFLQVDDMSMGFIRSEAVKTKCVVTGFTKA